MPSKPNINLSTLPYDLIYDICTYLSNDDIHSLRLVSKSTSSNIPPSRLEELTSQRTIFRHPREVARLNRLASLPIEKRAKIRHVILDLADPYVVPISSHEFDGLVVGYDDAVRERLVEFYKGYRSRKPLGVGGRYVRGVKRLAEGFFRSAGVIGGNTSDEAGREEVDPAATGGLSFTARSEIYSMFTESFTSNVDSSQLLKFRKAREKQDGGFDFFKVLIAAFEMLPNLSIISFKNRSRKEQNRDYVSTVWKAFNPSLAKFVKENPGLEGLPWHEWFQNCPDNSYGFTLAHAYPGVLFCAAHAKRQISEVRMDGFGWNRGVDSVPLWKFGRWYQAAGGLSFRPCVPREPHDTADMDAFRYTYKNLTRLEICVALDWTAEYTHEKEVSELFMTVIRNAQVLVITRLLDVRTEACKPSFVFPQMAVLPNLRTLELTKAGVTMKALAEFLMANKKSLKEVSCVLTVRHVVKREHMISFLMKVREQMDLKIFTMDFLTNKLPAKECHLAVDIRGGWRDDTARHGKYKVGTKCERGRFWWWYSARDRELLPRSSWETKTSWEDFVEGVEEVTTGYACREHWNGGIKDHD
ncbi:hypothetical protein TWF481_011280 [Arthrobotrys musiformis]|uniref:F-box domain-containing protein n=1 Tax=Arthrobotrys musiformis TaxID=47236 RepID=A0AAV9VYZ9_9PEZI